MSSSRGHTKPVIIEVRPDSALGGIAPSTPPLAKAVRFANSADELVTGVTRPLTRDEAWSLYHFENHARNCSACANPRAVFKRGDKLCAEGHALAQDVAQHVYYSNGQVYSVEPQADGTPMCVEISPSYAHLRSLLRVMERNRLQAARASGTAPPVVIDYSAYPPQSPAASPRRARRSSSIVSGGSSSSNNSDSEHRRPHIILEPGNSAAAARRKSTHLPMRYAKVVVNNNPERRASPSPAAKPAAPAAATSTSKSTSKERRGTLYEKEMQRKKETYRVEIREPSNRRERRREDRWQ